MIKSTILALSLTLAITTNIATANPNITIETNATSASVVLRMVERDATYQKFLTNQEAIKSVNSKTASRIAGSKKKLTKEEITLLNKEFTKVARTNNGLWRIVVLKMPTVINKNVYFKEGGSNIYATRGNKNTNVYQVHISR